MLYSTQTDFLFQAYPPEQAMDLFAAAGFPAIDYSMFHPANIYADGYKEDAVRMRSLAKERGLIFNQAHAPFGGGYERYYKETYPMLPRCIEYAAILGAKAIIVHPLQMGRFYGHEQEHFEANMAFYRSLAPFAKEFGIKIAIENMWQRHPVTHCITEDACSDPHEHANYFDALNDPEAFTLCLDIGHVALCEREPEDSIRILGHDRLGTIHTHDVDYVSDLHTVPGVSLLHWDEICRALGEIDYTGDLTLEADGIFHNSFREVSGAICNYMGAVAKELARRVDSYRVKK